MCAELYLLYTLSLSKMPMFNDLKLFYLEVNSICILF